VWNGIINLANGCTKLGGVAVGYFGFIPVYVPSWQNHRKQLNPSFNQQVLDEYMTVFNRQSRILMKDLECMVGKPPFDHKLLIERGALRTICGSVFGVKIDHDVEDFLKSYQNLFDLVTLRVLNPLRFFDFINERTKLYRDMSGYSDKVLKFSEEVLEKRIEEMKKMSPDELTKLSELKFKPFIDLLLQNKTFSHQQIIDEMTTMIVAGFETISTLLFFMLVILGTYSDVQEKIFNEIQEVFGDSDLDVTKDDLQKLKYTDAVIKESLRFSPIVPLIARYLTKDIQLKNRVLKKGFVCIILLYGALRHPMWGPDSEQFIPERWMDPDRLAKSPHAFAAFSFGKRNCIGKTYSFMAIKVQLVHFFRRYKVQADYSKLKMKINIIVKPESGHNISIQYRQKM
ncbi:unnamed protein product, partial [Leptidea sinapis]